MCFMCIKIALDVLWWPTHHLSMLTTTISQLFGSAAVFYGLMLPVFTAILLCLLLIPAFLKGARIVESGRAAYCVLAEGFGILLMAFGGLPTLASVLARVSLPPMTYASLLFTFVVAGLFLLLSIESGTFVNIPSSVLELIGISAATYGVSKGISSGSNGTAATARKAAAAAQQAADDAKQHADSAKQAAASVNR